jgi:short subunit dehydrogenase-like uncharacterized protein
MPERNRREFDVVVYGATGFTGRLVCDYLQTCYGRSVKWTMAGRDLAKLGRIRDDLGLTTSVIRADARDVKSMRALADRAQVLISTVGPYQLHGSTAVAACAALGTDYVDMTGEPVWMRDMMDAHSDAARASGARIIFSCGFDSIPFDLSVHELQKRYIDRWKRPAPRICCRVRGLEGGISGGTLATRRATEAAIEARPEIPALLGDPFLLTPGWRGATQPEMAVVSFDAQIGCWVAPFYMAFINTKHVHRTNFLGGYPYGRNFRYDEMTVVRGAGEEGRHTAEARAAHDPFAGLEALKSGDGPSVVQRALNYFDLLFIAEGPDGRLALACHGNLDPGYEGTSRMLVEAALCARETAGDGGFWTPASLLGDQLLGRLSNNAGIHFEEVDPSDVFGERAGQPSRV